MLGRHLCGCLGMQRNLEEVLGGVMRRAGRVRGGKGWKWGYEGGYATAMESLGNKSWHEQCECLVI